MPSANSHIKIVSEDGSEAAFSAVAGFRTRATDTTSAGPNYYHFVNTSGDWYIMRETIAGDIRTYKYYYEDASDLDTAWTNRASHTYVEFSAAF